MKQAIASVSDSDKSEVKKYYFWLSRLRV
jgi:hypothetical protein